MEQNKPEPARVEVEPRPVSVGLNYTMEELRREYAQIQGVYEAAIREINARLQTLDSEFSFQHMHNPIHHIESRVKSLPSIVKKLHSMGYPISISCAKKTLHDIAGVRVVCRYVDDIYKLADLLLAQDDISLILEKNYIRNRCTYRWRSRSEPSRWTSGPRWSTAYATRPPMRCPRASWTSCAPAPT